MSIKNSLPYSIARFYYKNFLSFNVIKQKLSFKLNLEKKYKPLVKELKKNGCVKLPNFFTQEEILNLRKGIVDQ